jgi:hypothetical protein
VGFSTEARHPRRIESRIPRGYQRLTRGPLLTPWIFNVGFVQRVSFRYTSVAARN